MQLHLLDIDDFIARNKVKEVTSIDIESPIRKGELDINGLWSPDIFGYPNSKERNTLFGYINLKVKILHPAIYNMLLNTNVELKKMITEEFPCRFSKGMIIPSDNGYYGLSYFLNNFDKYDIVGNAKKNKIKQAQYLEANRNLLLIDKMLVIPAGIRDINISVMNKRSIIMSDINNLYISLIKLTQYTISSIIGDSDDNQLLEKIQDICNKINIWIKNRLKGKRGLFRASLMKKSVDYCARGVVGSDPNIELGYIGIPWHVAVVIYEPFLIHYINTNAGKQLKQLILDFIKKDIDMTYSDIKQFMIILNRSKDSISEALRTELITFITELTKDKQIIYKRDPVVKRSNWQSAHIKILEDGELFMVSPIVDSALGADHDGDTIAVYPLFTDESNEEAKQMNPMYSKTCIQDVSKYNSLIYSIGLEALSAIYEATRR